ncbi:MAG: DUF4263 domain-containing protein [Albidovulum sp.]|nr:DUF4263 domain-containing protein [Albidovulum sp.]
MIREFEHMNSTIHGSLVIEEPGDGGCVEVFYVPPPLPQVEHGIDPSDAESHKTKLLEIDIKSGRLTILPLNTLISSENYLKPKYEKIRRITLADGKPVLSSSGLDSESDWNFARSVTFGPTRPLEHDIVDAEIASSPDSEEQIIHVLESLPPAFTKDYDHGLGLAKPYRFIVEAVEDLTDCTEIVISQGESSREDETTGVFYIKTSDFETVRKMLNSTTHLGQIAGRTVKETEVYNFFAERLGLPPKALKFGRHRLRRLFTEAVHHDDGNLSEDEQDEVIGLVTRNARSISNSRPERLLRLQNDLELANLQRFIDRLHMMIQEHHGEPVWQKFFDENPLILSLAFGYPVIKLGQQPSVGGRKLFGGGEKIADFLMKNRMTNNAAVVEIKTPGAKLLSREFRSSVFSPSAALSEGIVQALDQRYQFQRDIFGIRGRSGINDIESYTVQCCLVIGTIPESEEEKKSFELFRGNSKDVQVVTFDELLNKLIQLKELLVSPEEEDNGFLPETDPPF